MSEHGKRTDVDAPNEPIEERDTLNSSADANSITASPEVQDAGTADNLRFLSPAQSEGELGRLAGYRILRVLGQGGMGMVLDAEDVRLKRHIAIKVMKPEVAAKESHRQRFLREAQHAAAIEHDHIIPIFQVGEENGVPFIAMPFLKGEPLDARMRSGRVSVPEMLQIGRQVAEGLAAAHQHGLVHRDIKPGNIWLEKTQAGFRVKILDFGLARLSQDDVRLTQSGAIIGTPAYMAPEQARGQSVDHRADLFSLGVVLYEMATGKRPFTGNDAMAIISSLALDTPAPPIELNPQLSPIFSRLIMRLLEKDPAKRVQSAADVVDVLKRLQPEATVVVIAAPQPKVEANPWQDIDASSATNFVPPLAPSRESREQRVEPRPRPVIDETRPVIEPATPTSGRSRGSARPWLIGAALLGIAAIIIIVLMNRGKNDPPSENKDRVVDNSKEKIVPKPKDKQPEPKVIVEIAPGTRSPFDDLDPAKIPAIERAWMPEKTVAVVGTHQGIGWENNELLVSSDGKWLIPHTDGRYLLDGGTLYPRLNLGMNSTAAAFSPDSKRLAVAVTEPDQLPTVTIYDLSAKDGPSKISSFVPWKNISVRSLAWLPDNTTLAAGSTRGTVGLWDTQGDLTKPVGLIRSESNDSDYVGEMHISGNSKRLAARFGDPTSKQKIIRVFDLSGAKLKEPFAFEPIEGLRSFALIPNSERLVSHAVVGKIDMLTLWDISGTSPKKLHSIEEGVGDAYNAFAISAAADGKTILLLRPTLSLRLVIEADQIKKGADLPDRVVAFAPDLSKFIIAKNKRLGIVDSGGTSILEAATVVSDGTAIAGRLITCNVPATIWNIQDGGLHPTVAQLVPPEPQYNYPLLHRPIAQLNGRLFAGFLPTSEQRIVELTGDTLKRRITINRNDRSNSIPTAVWQPDSPILFTVDWYGLLERIDLTGAQAVRTVVGKVHDQDGNCTLAVAPGGKMFAVKPWNNRQWTVFTLTGGKLHGVPIPVDESYGSGVASFTPDGRRLLIGYSPLKGNGPSLLKSFNPTHPEQPSELFLEDAGAMYFQLSPDGAFIVFHADEKMIVWDMRTKTVSARISTSVNKHGRVNYVRWTDDSRHLVLNQNGLVYVIRVAEAPKVDAERAAAEWALANGGRVVLAGKTKLGVSKAQELPPGPFQVVSIRWDAAGPPIADVDIDRLLPLAALETLAIGNVPLSDAGMEKLTRASFAPNLRSLSLQHLKTTSAGLAHLARFQKLEMPAFYHCKLDDSGLAHLQQLPALQKLIIGAGTLSVAALEVIGKFSSLRELSLSQCGVTDAGLEKLKGLKLETLSLGQNGVTDEGLRHLHGMTTLQELRWGTGNKVNQKAVDELAAALPGCKITWPGGVEMPTKPVAKIEEVSLDLGNGVKLDVVKINAKGKTFLMGSPKDEPGRDKKEETFDREEQHEVTFGHDYFMGKFEVTQEQYEAVMGKNPSTVKGAKNPVETVSWHDDQQFIAKLNDKFKDRKVKFRLPSEAEWEYACRAGTTTAFHFGMTLTAEQANFANVMNTTKAVGSYQPNAYGLFDMHGNVWELCEDYLGPYSKAPADGTAQIVKQMSDERVRRGGSFINNSTACRSAFRIGNSGPGPIGYIGFRVAVDIADDSPLLARSSPIDILTSPAFEWTKPEKLGPTVNIAKDNVAPTLSADELILIFSSTRKTKSSRLYECRRKSVDEPFGEPVMIDPGDSRRSDPSLSANGLTLLFSSNEEPTHGGEDIFMLRRDSREAPWQKPVNLGPPINSKSYEYGACLSPDGLSLVFDSNRSGSGLKYFGGSDIWISRRKALDSAWEEPANLGRKVNSPQGERDPVFISGGRAILYERTPKELRIAFQDATGEWDSSALDVPFDGNVRTPFLAADGKTLYFAGNIDPKAGGWDIWVTRRVRKK